MIKNLCWYLHRAFCLVGLHAPERIFVFDDGSDLFKPDGWFCVVCTKTWEEKRCSTSSR